MNEKYYKVLNKKDYKVKSQVLIFFTELVRLVFLNLHKAINVLYIAIYNIQFLEPIRQEGHQNNYKG